MPTTSHQSRYTVFFERYGDTLQELTDAHTAGRQLLAELLDGTYWPHVAGGSVGYSERGALVTILGGELWTAEEVADFEEIVAGFNTRWEKHRAKWNPRKGETPNAPPAGRRTHKKQSP